MMRASARQIAFDILRKVESGGYASDLLLAHSGGLDSRDAGLASEIVFGVLRYRAQLRYLIERYSGRRRKLDPEVRIALEMGIYQLRYLERIPAHAAVAESVALVKRARKTSAAGFVNAVLRKVNRDPMEWPSREIGLSCPEWLLARWEAFYGPDAAAEIARAAMREPAKYSRGGRVQDIGSQSIVPLLGLEPGQWFLDLCAAPGNKTAQALESGVRAIACDLHFHRVAGMKGLGAGLLVLDGTQPLPFARRFDRILVDAPCSGTGTLARNPEIKWKLRPEDLADLQQRQVALLRNALAVLKPGGTLVYSTCSLEPEENDEVLAKVGQTASPHDDSKQVPGRLESTSSSGGIEPAAPRDYTEKRSRIYELLDAGHQAGRIAGAACRGIPGSGEPEAPPARGQDREPGRGGPAQAGAAEGRPPDSGSVDFPTEKRPALPDPYFRRLPGRDPGDGFFAAVIKSEIPANG